MNDFKAYASRRLTQYVVAAQGDTMSAFESDEP